MQELEFDHNLFAQAAKGDEKLYVRFYPDVLPDPEETAKTGIRKFRDVTMISIMTPGDKTNIIVREVREGDRERFPKQWEAYEKQHQGSVEGFPLSEWSLASRAMVEELKYLGFQSVEHVAAASDAICSKYPGLTELKRRATHWLQAQKDAAPIEQLNSALEQRDKQIAALQAQMNELLKAQTGTTVKK